MRDVEPLAITDKAQLFIDDRLVASARGVQECVNRPVLDGVALSPGPVGAWDDAWVGVYGQVFEDDGVFKMYMKGRSVAHIRKLLSGSKPSTPLGYAESEDGIHWRRPDLGLCEYEGSRENNISCMDGGYVLKDPNASGADRYKLLVFAHHHIGADSGPDLLDRDRGGFYILTSPDGLRWDWNGNRFFPFQADTLNQLDWDPKLMRYVAYLRTWPDGFLRGRERAYGRAVGRIELDDPMRPWPYDEIDDPFYTAGPDAIATLSREVPTVLTYPGYDQPGNWTDVYTPAVLRHPDAEDVYLAFPAVNHYNPDSELRNNSRLDIGMAVSRDGVTWTWPSLDPYVPLGEPGSGRSSCVYMFYGMVQANGRIYQYHHGCDLEHGALRRSGAEGAAGSGAVYRTVLRQDGFVSMDFEAGGGELTTRTFTTAGDSLHLNIDAQAGGGKVGVAGEDGGYLPGLGIDDCDEIKTDAVDHVVTWRGQRRMTGTHGRAIRLVFRMHRAKLFSFRVC
jgi:hypothetical protein